MSTYAMYVRKSSDAEDRQVLSIPAQLSVLRELAERRGIRVASDALYQESKSAKAPGRPVFDQMMKRVQSGKFTGILCWKPDRLARNPVDSGVLLWALSSGKIREIVSPEQTFTDNSNDRMMLNISFVFATKFIDDLSVNVRRGFQALLALGRAPSGVPLGYRKERPEGALRGAGKAVPDGDRFVLLKKLWQMLLTGAHTVPELLDVAMQWGLRGRPTKHHPGGTLSLPGLYNIFGNPFYCGLLRSKGQTYRGEHQPMISLEEFERAQEILGRVPHRRRRKHVFTYSGLIRCGACGRAVVAERHVNAYGKTYVYYRCVSRTPCEQRQRVPYVSERCLDEQVLLLLLRLRLPERIADAALGALPGIEEEDRQSAFAQARELRKELRACEDELARYTGLFGRGHMSEGEYLENRKRLDLSIQRLRREVKQPEETAIRWTQDYRRMLGLLPQAFVLFRGGDRAKRRELLAEVASNCSLDGQKLAIQLRFPYSELLSKDDIVEASRLDDSNFDGDASTPLQLAKTRGVGGPRVLENSSWCSRLSLIRTLLRKRHSSANASGNTDGRAEELRDIEGSNEADERPSP